MHSLLRKLTILTASSALLMLAVGCQTSWFARNQSKEKELEPLPPRSASQSPAPKSKAKPKPGDDASAAADEATKAQIMRDVAEISAKDPAAGKLLVAELSKVEPKLWPLTLLQFRSRQAYHEQLLNGPKKHVDPVADESTEPPSELVGQLTDPRRIRPDAAVEQAFAKATPANMPAPIDAAPPATTLVSQAAPAHFADDPSAVPLASEEPRTIANTQVVQASGASTGEVEPAIYSADASPPAAKDSNYTWQQHLKFAIDDLDERLVEGPRSTAEVHQLVSLRLLELLAGNTEAALKPIPNVSTEEQDYWSSQLFALATFLDHHRQPDDDRRAAASVVHLDEAVGHLRELGTLALRNLAFCKVVYGYGAYEPIDNPSFTPGQQVTLYLEVENYHSESTLKGYATKLAASYELVNEEGERVASGDFPGVEDCCQSRRRDFHIQYGLVLPKTAKAGKHELKLTMKDRQSDKMGNTSISFEIR